jgi:hypothetical protein
MQFGSYIHTIGNVGECEGMNLHTLRWAFTLGIGVLMDSQVLESNLKNQNSLD